MDAARPRNRVAPSHATGDGVIGGLPSYEHDSSASAGRRGREAVERRRALVVTAGAAVAADAGVWGFGAGTFAGLPGAYWRMAVLAVVVDARPYVLADRRASSVAPSEGNPSCSELRMNPGISSPTFPESSRIPDQTHAAG